MYKRQPGDILIDGGNSNYEDTNRRVKLAESKGFLFVGSGVSGGEEGALNGASIMPGGSEKAWPEVKPILQSIAAKASDGTCLLYTSISALYVPAGDYRTSTSDVLLGLKNETLNKK